MLDLRLPSGLFFVLTGAILTGAGLFASGNPAPLQQANVNLFSGVVMLVFGGFLLLLARRARS
jgi:predicted transporter